jgi:hypothetical protein
MQNKAIGNNKTKPARAQSVNQAEGKVKSWLRAYQPPAHTRRMLSRPISKGMG